ncbi:non-ribosomal peptide synthetase [Catellatospora sichuanensis]|uniref:non-ribosomal peptide synthetase n=1 Tax=Catellatospora sichuanensis TaxID=1969805 RepID=UPI001642674A|nr:non-ribosomal peptide synthetase [Catellatospora sichuanensis]
MPAESLITRTDPVPLTDAQHGIWFAEQLGDNRAAYHLGLVVDLHGELDGAALDRAVVDVVARHPVLAAALDVRDGQPSLRPGRHRVRLDRADPADPAGLIALPFTLDGSAALTRFTLQRIGPARHRLVLAAHHLVWDGRSKDILLRDLAHAYRAPADPGPIAASGYEDAVRAERQRAKQLAEAARAHWSEQWSAPLPLLLPGARVPAGASGTASGPGGSVDVPVSAAVHAALDDATRDAGCTRFEFLLAAVHLLLHRYGNDTVTVAVDVGTRDRDHADVVGMFVNELPVTTYGPVTGSCADLAVTLRAQLRAAYPLRAVPVGRSVPVRAGAALAAATLSYRRRDPQPVFVGLDTVVDWAPHTGAARSPLHLHLVDADDELVVRLRYDGHHVDAATAAAVARQLAHLLPQLVREPAAPARHADTVPEAEAAWVRDQLSGPPATAETTLTELLRRAEPGSGDDNPGVVFGPHRLTRSQVHDATSRLARRLTAQGIGPGQVVGLCAPRGITQLIGLLAIVRTGAAYLPLDPQHPAQRLQLVLDDTAPALVLCCSAGREALPPTSLPVLVLDESEPGMPVDALLPPGDDGQADSGRSDAPSPGDPAYIIHTSGSTGRPKGVVVPHRAIANLLQALAADLGSGPGDVWLGLTSPAFDISTVECFLPQLTGACLVLADDTQVRDGAALLRTIRATGVTHVQATPSTWELILAAEPADRQDPAAAPIAATALCGGEPLTPALAARLLPRVSRLVNVYGPTETTVWSTLADITAPDRVTIGRPIAGTTAYVLDRDLRPVPVGITGQLCLAGVGVADHYHDRPALTAARFLPDPYGPPGSRVYLTGDHALLLADGTLACLGRDDLQVKIRGHRIELGEIEARLREHPAVTGAAVAVLDEPAGRRLVAYVTGPAAADEPSLRAHLAAYLPEPLLPGVFVRLDMLPTTPNGKLDRAALPPPCAAVPPGRSSAPEPGDDLTAAMTAIWCEALEVTAAGPDDDLFDSGGHSLTVTRILARVRDRFDVDLPLHVLWDAPTLRAVTAAVRQAAAR